MFTNERLIVAVAVLFFAAGLIFGWWPLSFFGALLAAVLGRWIIALVLAFSLDSLFGTPTGFLHSLVFPFTLLTVVLVVVRAFSIRHLR